MPEEKLKWLGGGVDSEIKTKSRLGIEPADFSAGREPELFSPARLIISSHTFRFFYPKFNFHSTILTPFRNALVIRGWTVKA